MREIYVTVGGVPVPQGSMRVFGKCVTHSNPKLKGWRKSIVAAILDTQSLPYEPLSGPVYAYLIFLLPRPKTVKRDRPSVKPDLDKLVRAVFDACEKAGAISEDSQVVELQAVKRYAGGNESPGLTLLLREV